MPSSAKAQHPVDEHAASPMSESISQRTVKTRNTSNPQSPISAQVFLELRAQTGIKTLKWISVTHVCRAWRTIGLEYASLWTCVPMDAGKDCIAAFVTRSKTLPLCAPGLWDLSGKPHELDFLRKEMHRITDLQIGERADTTAFGQLLSIISLSTPKQLVTIDLSPGSDRHWEISSEQAMFLRRAPQLQDITLSGLSMLWNCLPWAQLLNVEVSISSANSLLLNFDMLVNSLANARVLETLYLNMSGFDFTPSDHSPTVVAHLSALQHFSFEGSAPDLRLLCNALRMPPTASLNIDLLSGEGEDIAQLSMLSALLRVHSGYDEGSSPGRVQSLQLHADRSVDTISLEAFQSTGTFECGERRDLPFLRINVYFFNNEAIDDIYAGALQLCRSVDPRSLRQLHVTFSGENRGCSAETWRSFLYPAYNVVESIYFGGDDIRGFLDALAPLHPADGVSEPPPSSIPLPSLRYVLLGDGKGYGHGYDYDAQGLPDRLKARAQHTPIEKLTIKRLSIRSQTVDELKAIVGLEVEWDGKQGIYEHAD